MHIPFWLAPKVVRETGSPEILRAWFQHENDFCRRQLATSFIGVGLLILGFIPLDMHLGDVNPNLTYVLLLRGIPSFLFLLGGLYLRFGHRFGGEQAFLLPKVYGIALVGILTALQYCYAADFPDRARFYPPLIAAFAVFTLRVDWFEAILIFAMQVWVWMLFSEWNANLIVRDINYQLFGCVLALLFQRRIAYEAANFVSEEKRRIIERENAMLRLKRTSMLLQRFLPPDVARDIIQGGFDFNARPKKMTVTMLFCDIADFTGLTERVSLERLGEFLNRYFAAMTEVTFAHGGMIDKFIGDGVLAIFGFPGELSPAEQAQKAAQCAREMLQMLPLVQKDIGAEFEQAPVKVRIGIHQGEVIIGGFGGEARTDYMALGATPLMAQRLKASASEGGILVSESVAEALTYMDCEDYGERMLRGIGPRRVFQLQAVPEDSLHGIGRGGFRDKMAA
ncbi:adenylate/guanylate cyclase domain-containing protein [Oligoflexus tunisiensis]|uniref:adenylate/guanylate cyclase domain-containing protein n=1 Tax=Oligoflexus tunisiensis TaxID=708132 RepID=UPI000A4528E4|nr:adenylate/guanylate cyclase domain-containing protein [Oligoflexus tunisiensis]